MFFILQTLEKAVQRDPLFVIAKLDLARYYNHHGDVKKAEQLFEEALEVHPDSFDGHIHYGDFLFEKVCLISQEPVISSRTVLPYIKNLGSVFIIGFVDERVISNRFLKFSPFF